LVGLLARTLSTDVREEVIHRFAEPPKLSLFEEDKYGVLRHARVSRVRRLSRRYLLAELELLEQFEDPPGPAQFVMIWLPGIDYIPMSIANSDEGRIHIFFSVRGEGTRALANSKGKMVGVVGPLGKPLAVSARSKYVLIAGGTGLAPIIKLARGLSDMGLLAAVIWGTRAREDVGEVPFYFKEVTGCNLTICTEDCSVGFCGRAADLAEEVLPDLENTQVVAAGPNDMLITVADLSMRVGIDPVLILESMVECGLGVCGRCVLGSTGLRLCRDGPAFRASEVMDYLVDVALRRGQKH